MKIPVIVSLNKGFYFFELCKIACVRWHNLGMKKRKRAEMDIVYSAILEYSKTRLFN